jgi:hypothetical protein
VLCPQPMCCAFFGWAAKEVRVTGVTLPKDDTEEGIWPTGATEGFHVDPPLKWIWNAIKFKI